MACCWGAFGGCETAEMWSYSNRGQAWRPRSTMINKAASIQAQPARKNRKLATGAGRGVWIQRELGQNTPLFFNSLSIFTHLLKRFLFLLSNTKPLSCLWMNKKYHFLFLFQENTMCGSQLIKVCVRELLQAAPTCLSLPWERVCWSKDR